MGITYISEEKLFKLDTPKTTYCIGLIDQEGFLGHAYYGRRIHNVQGVSALMRLCENPMTPETNARDRLSFLDSFPTEYSAHGVGDYRESSVRVRSAGGHSAVLLTYDSHEIYQGKEALAGLPATFGGDGEVTTLAITCRDRALGLRAVLSYSVFEDTDAIARSVRFYNDSDQPIFLEKAMSACLDMDDRDYDMITLHGSWARERRMDRRRVSHGKHAVSSLRGEPGHQEHPFLALLEHTATQTRGDVYGFSFVYSGNFRMQAERSQFDSVRVTVGIEPEDFSWKLASGESFQTPEVILVYSGEGLGGMSRAYHDLYRKHLIRSPYRNKKRPILINNWEATYFDFDEEKLLDIRDPYIHTGVDFNASSAAMEGEVGATIRIGTLLAAGFGMAFPALKWFLRWRKRCKARPPKPERKTKKPKGHPPEEPPTEKPAA